MKLENFLLQKKGAILKRWFDLLLEAYPDETVRFLKGEKNPFTNPVGHTIHQGIAGLYEGLLQGLDQDKTYTFLDNIIRIRAVQDFSPSQAVAFIFLLKKVIREELESEIRESRVSAEELLKFESKIDELALLSFDIYMECREKICDVRINETKNRLYRLLQKANLMVDYSEEEPDLQDGSVANRHEMRISR
ncbi:RsbRD N-terminal domain-containing protein [Calderihabitans maritimus]|nr:RsbRD N-terminal domain-containing protein [Calderihabitans maritimus]